MAGCKPNRYSREPCNYTWNQMADGVAFNIRYVGRIPIEISMKVLDFAVRTALAKECIVKVCEAARYITPQKKRQIPKEIRPYLTSKTDLTRAGENVDFIVSTKCISVLVSENQKPLFMHSMPNISFASGGDGDTAEFVCYFGKEEMEGRYCFVFECGVTLAADVLSAIGQAFSKRFQEFQRRAAPPDIHTYPTPNSFELTPGAGQLPAVQSAEPNQNSMCENVCCGPGSPALIDFDPTPTPPPRPGVSHVYVNDSAMSSNSVKGSSCEANDVLCKEVWYHGPISRQQAELLLKNDGDFLVRKKENENQYVLTGMQNGTARHLLLIDEKGEVRTRDKRFLSISHLIQYHQDNNLPITSTESVIVLKTAVLRGPR